MQNTLRTVRLNAAERRHRYGYRHRIRSPHSTDGTPFNSIVF